ncbi:MAG TPA: signal recognition particle-docking protein FtsY [Actinomycetota bacterium]|jgi:fused signal recognition particle receptor|nr:signal recognition particle-docking protein FtsY [Actinomycetota bacterium]
MPIAIVVVLVLVGVVAFVVVSRRGGTAGRGVPMPESIAPPAPGRADGLGARVRSIFRGATAQDEDWRRLEELLLRADVGPETARRIVDDVRARYEADGDAVALIRDELVSLLEGDASLHLGDGELTVFMVVGVNGSGKTTTIGKLAAWLSRQGHRVGLANSDTYRAAAAEQLDVWAKRAGVPLVSQDRGADPGAVAYDAVQAAKARGTDVLIVDTAGRLHTATPLMDELRKLRRVLEKANGRPPDEVLLVLDATTGQNGIAQATAFTEAVDVTGVALTKFDGTAKGGVLLAVRERLGVPVKLVGMGERLDDLEPFDPRAFADRILGG